MFSVSEVHNSSRQYHYLFKFHGIICRYIVPYFLQKKIVLLPTKRKIRLLSAARRTPISIGWCLQVCMTRRSICIHRWFILSRFVVSWNRPFRQVTLVTQIQRCSPFAYIPKLYIYIYIYMLFLMTDVSYIPCKKCIIMPTSLSLD